MAVEQNGNNHNKNLEKLKEITDMIEKGIKELFNSDMYKKYLKTMSKFTNYSVNNTLLISMQKPDATLVAGYEAWRTKFGRHVNRGAKAIKILAPAVLNKKELVAKLDPATQKPVTDLYGNPVKEEVEIQAVYFKPTYVFDVSQTSGKELPKLGVDERTGDVKEYKQVLDALKNISPMPIDFINIESGAKGYCNYNTKRIAIQEGMSQVHSVKTAIHEISHAKLHNIDLNAKDADASMLKDKKTKEVEAESVAFTVCQHYGIDTSDYSFPYIAAWSENKELPELKASLQTIRDTAAEFISQIDERLLQQEKQHEQQQAQKQAQSEDKEPKTSIVPVYYESAKYAYDHNESKLWQQSFKLNCQCADYIRLNAEKEHSNHNLNSFFNSLVAKFGIERSMYVMARNIKARQNDRRFSYDVRNRVGQLQFPDMELKFDNSAAYLYEVHSGILNMLFEDAMKLEASHTKLPCNISIEDMNKYGYTYENMLPLDFNTAAILFDNDYPIYALHPDNSESLIDTRDELESFDGLFGIERQDWIEAIDNNLSLEPLNPEANFIFGKENGFAIYQLDDGHELINLRYESLNNIGGIENVDKNNYRMVYHDTIDTGGIDTEDDAYETLNQIFEQFNAENPSDFKGHSLSVSDIIVLKNNDELSAFYVDRFGFELIPDFYGNDVRNIDWDRKNFANKAAKQAIDNENSDLLYEVMSNTKHQEYPHMSMEDRAISGNATLRKPHKQQSNGIKPSLKQRLEENKRQVGTAINKPANIKKHEKEV